MIREDTRRDYSPNVSFGPCGSLPDARRSIPDTVSLGYLDADFRWARLSNLIPTGTIPTNRTLALHDLFLFPLF